MAVLLNRVATHYFLGYFTTKAYHRQTLAKKNGSPLSEIIDSSATRLSHKDPWAFRPTLADGLVLSLPSVLLLQFLYPLAEAKKM